MNIHEEIAKALGIDRGPDCEEYMTELEKRVMEHDPRLDDLVFYRVSEEDG